MWSLGARMMSEMEDIRRQLVDRGAPDEILPRPEWLRKGLEYLAALEASRSPSTDNDDTFESDEA